MYHVKFIMCNVYKRLNLEGTIAEFSSDPPFTTQRVSLKPLSEINIDN